jgi:hypothetical protein
MDALIIFSSGNEHPLNWMLDKQHRHVWCAVRGETYWHVYNWHQGIPIIEVADGEYDLAAHYRAAGCEVIKTTVGRDPCHGPWMCNNCVGHTMVICGIRAHFIFTPHQLWRHLTGKTMIKRIIKFFKYCEFVPGFGGGKTVYVPAPPVEAQASQTTVAADAKLADDAAKTAASKKAAANEVDASSTLLDDGTTTGGALK